MDISIVKYSEKCIVVCGEDTESVKEDLKRMAGKWNARLTNKETGERFGGWIFPVKFQSDIEKFLASDKPSKNLQNKDMREVWKRIEKMLERIMDVLETKDEESEEEIPHKRLLK